MNTIRAILVDDELKSRQYLQQIITKYTPQVIVVGEAANANEAVALIENEKPNLVFLDIEMPGQSGVDMLRQLHEINFEVVFVTAFNRYAVEAFRLGAVDYLLKPTSPSDLQQAIERVQKNLHAQEHEKTLLKDFTKSYGQPFSKITIPTLTGFEFVDFAEIIYLKSEGNYTSIYLKNAKEILATRQLGDFEEVLEPYNFFRIHKSYLINLTHISKYTKGDGGTILMVNGAEIDVARRMKDAFLKRIKL